MEKRRQFMKKIYGSLVPILIGILCFQTAIVPGKDVSDAERVAKNKQIIFSRLKRDPVKYRGEKPGEMRFHYLWYNKVINDFIFEKNVLLEEASVGEKFAVRESWFYKDMKVTFQELFQLGADQDDKLLPILSDSTILYRAPASTFEGLTLRGRHGEVKGIVARKLKLISYLYTLRYFTEWLEYKDAENGKLKFISIGLTGGFYPDSTNVLWKDIKDRVAFDMTEAKILEDMKMERDAQYPAEEGGGK
jgi:hypothetical protein